MQDRLKARLWRYLPALLITALVWASCTKKPDSIGIDLLDDSKPFVGKDTTFNLLAYSLVEDSVISDETSLNLLGSMYSETFGRTNTSIYTQVRISSLNPDWGSNPVADSVIFTMVYDGYYGNLETEQTVRAFRVLEDMERDSSYWSNISFATEELELGSLSFFPDLEDILVVDSGGGTYDSSYVRAELRIPFEDAFADYMFTLDTTHTSSSEAFLEEFKGIYLRSDDVNTAGEGAILYFDLLDDRSNLTIYYHNDSADSLRFRFFINLNNARVGRYEHEYLLGSQDFISQVLNGDTALGTQDLYLQGTGGVKTNIYFPGLLEWANASERIINEAKLVINVAEEYDEHREPSSSLILFKNTATQSFDFVPDQLEGENYFGGSYDKESNSYFFRVSMHIQNLLAGEKDLGLGLFPTAKSIKATEMRLHGTGPQDPRRFMLQITYTDIE